MQFLILSSDEGSNSFIVWDLFYHKQFQKMSFLRGLSNNPVFHSEFHGANGFTFSKEQNYKIVKHKVIEEQN